MRFGVILTDGVSGYSGSDQVRIVLGAGICGQGKAVPYNGACRVIHLAAMSAKPIGPRSVLHLGAPWSRCHHRR